MSTVSSTARTAAAACGTAAVLLIATAAAFRWSGQPTVVGIVCGVLLLVLAVMWKGTDDVPRLLPAMTMLVGIVLVVAPPVLDYNDGADNDFIAVAYLVHVLTGLALASLGYWSGKRVGAPRVDQV